jgi:succinate dehydrogenase / fumarate reductase flavoprotein subunit
MGEVSFAYHGANRLGANSLLSCIFDGLFGGTCIRNYINDVVQGSANDVSETVYSAIVGQETDRQNWLVKNTGGENPYLLWQEMGKVMTDTCTVIRYNDGLKETLAKCQEWKARYRKVQLSDTGMWTNQNLSFARAVRDMIIMAEAILQGALLRNESRGAHYKPEFPDRDDANFLKCTLATYDAASDSPRITYGPVDVSLVPPRKRDYGKIEGAGGGPKVAEPKTPAKALAT